ncbi:SDR family oxidoreductase [Solidesulfovibrio sp.]|uniref:SDR family NAD(P)-dependent oxidoreductase n=1 Tax=Solidesulfovibrio sp. TaxID=2910990 RepID=UPI0026191DE1|nr:SDR family oxidoreductase [Solidesulfovibrio sp.]
MKGAALVTGAAGGIGLACAEALAREGLRVYGLDMVPPAGQAAFAGFGTCDLAQEGAGVRAAAQLLAGEDAGLVCLVNNAALQVAKPLERTSPAEFQAVLATNLLAPFQLSVALLDALGLAGGAIVNIASVHAQATSREIGAYAASKAALLGLTRTMALEFAARGIRANAVLPGAVDTPMLRRGLERDLHGAADPLAELARRHPLGRVGRPEEIAQAVVFLADPAKSSFMTGQGLVVDGGCLCKLATE